MMLTTLLILSSSTAALAAPPSIRSEYHNVHLINNCGSGNAVFLFANSLDPQGSGTINGPLAGGVAWITGLAGHDCQNSGVNCGTVEFTLTNGVPGNTYNAADYSLQAQGNHQFSYPMYFQFTGSCTTRAPGPCMGASSGACPGAYIGYDTFSGTTVACQGDNAGIEITFCAAH